MGEIVLSKYEHLMLPGAFPDKVTPFIDTIGKAVVQCYVPVVKMLCKVLPVVKRCSESTNDYK